MICRHGMAVYFSAALMILTGGLGVIWKPVPVDAKSLVNTATVNYINDTEPVSVVSNLTNIPLFPAPEPADIKLFRHAPGSGLQLPTDGAMYYDAAGVMHPLTPPKDTSGNTLSTAVTPVVETETYQVGEPVFIQVTDRDKNVDPLARDVLDVTVTTSTGDQERLRLQETGPNTGVFMGVIQGNGVESAAHFSGQLYLPSTSRVKVSYTDPLSQSDSVEDVGLVDPFGTAFDVKTGRPVNGAIITLMSIDNGNREAEVFGDEGERGYPAKVISGPASAQAGAAAPKTPSLEKIAFKSQNGGEVTTTDASGNIRTYPFPPGQYRFPRVDRGKYNLIVEPPDGYTLSPKPAQLSDFGPVARPDGGGDYAVVEGSFGEPFDVLLYAVKIDIPLNPVQTPLLLKKTASKTEASAGDFLQYTLTLEHRSDSDATDVIITDQLPLGMRYEPGSFRRNNGGLPDPTISPDGRTLTFSIGNLTLGETVSATYVVFVGAGARSGQAINRATARDAQNRVSNSSEAGVRIRKPLLRGDVTLIGRVVYGACSTRWNDLQGVPNMRVLMEDGASVMTDTDGQYHFRGVRSGTHVVQLDRSSLPSYLTVLPCIDNSRFAGNPFSQFVDAQGGLWRADFYVGPKAPIKQGIVGIHLEGTMTLEEKKAPEKPLVRSLESEALFSTLSAKMRPPGIKALKKLTAEIGRMQIDRIEVVGHTDSRKIHSVKQHLFRDNYALSEARAQSVVDYLVKNLKLSPKKVRAIGRGPDQPVATNRTHAGMAKNRRVEVLVYVVHNLLQGGPTGSGKHFRYRVAVDGDAESVKDLKVLVIPPPGVSYIPHSTRINGVEASDPQQENNTFIYALGNLEKRWKYYIEFSGWLETPTPSISVVRTRDHSCPEEGFAAQTFALFETPSGSAASTPTVQNKLLCPPFDTSLGSPDHSPIFLAKMSDRQATTVLMGPLLPSPSTETPEVKPPSDIEAAGGGIDWLAGQSPGIAWLFPAWEHNPRSRSLRIVIKHAPGQSVILTHQDQPVDSLYLDSVDSNDKVAVTLWRGIPLAEGPNLFRAHIYNARGRLVDTLTRKVHYSSQPVRVELVSQKSVLVADGIQNPKIAVRLFDRDNRWVHAGITGTYSVNAPYVSAEILNATQQRSLAGSDRFRPTLTVVGDEGMALIKLAPTLESGEVIVKIYFQNGEKERSESVRVWLEPALRDWVLVGFAEGSIGYNTLSGNVQPLPSEEREEGIVTEGQVKFYAKGRVLGKWLLTLAYNSNKQHEQRDTKGLFSGIDPDRFYTLYGDGTEPVYDATSQKNLYLKLSRNQYYILFGDYNTGLTETQLTRYNRSLTGVKTEYHGPLVDVLAYHAETALHYAKDEIQGNGTSGLYSLSRGNIVINSEKIRIETRDRLHSEQITASRPLIRHLDYDMDYQSGTLFFREPLQSRDGNFNPIFMIAEYETLGPSGAPLVNAGGRVGVHLLEERLRLGASHIRDETFSQKSDLSGLDMTLRIGQDTLLRIEGAQSDGEPLNSSGEAYLVELESHERSWDSLLYLRRQEASFGMGQQNGSEAGTQKEGLEGRFSVMPQVSLDTEISRQENLMMTAHRDLGKVQIRHHTDLGSVYAGGRFVSDAFQGGSPLRSEQAIVGASHFFLDKRLEVQLAGEFPMGSDNKNESLDFPIRSRLGIHYTLTDSVRLLMAHEVADGAAFRTYTTRAGFQAIPWKGAQLTQTLNQQQISEYGPRTFGAFGLTQSFLISERWGFDLSADSHRTFKESGIPPPVLNRNYPISSGGMLGDGATPEDFLAVSSGLTYRAEQWSWNARIESRDAEKTERYGITTNFLRQRKAGVAFGLSAQAFQTEEIASKTKGLFQNVSLSWAYRPLGQSWSVLDRLEFRYDALQNGTGNVTAANFGVPQIPLLGNNHSRRFINNITINRVSQLWTNNSDSASFYRNQRNQGSLYYGMKYVLDQINQVDYKGLTDLIGLEWRYDLTRRIDIGLQAGMLHSWRAEHYDYVGGPRLGLSPFGNSWITLGYNIAGFYDRDFRDAGYTRKGPFLQVRMKFDENSMGGG